MSDYQVGLLAVIIFAVMIIGMAIDIKMAPIIEHDEWD